MGLLIYDFTTNQAVPAPLFYAACGYHPPRLPLDICPRCYGSGVEYVRDWMGFERPFACDCENGQRAKRTEIAAIGHDTLYLPVERQVEALEPRGRRDAWYWRSLLEEDAAQDRRELAAWAAQAL